MLMLLLILHHLDTKSIVVLFIDTGAVWYFLDGDLVLQALKTPMHMQVLHQYELGLYSMTVHLYT